MIELIDQRLEFGKKNFPNTFQYYGSDKPHRWYNSWKNTGFLDWEEHYLKKKESIIEYKFNSQGYRTKEWTDIDWNSSFIFLGCSHTQGISVNEDETLPAQVERLTGIPCINLGFAGGSDWHSMINSSILINNDIKPLAVFMQYTYKSRWLAWDGHLDSTPLVINEKTYQNKLGLYKAWLSDLTNLEEWSHIVPQMIHSIWKDIKLIEYTHAGCDRNFSYYDKNINDPLFIARDGCHWNGNYHRLVAEWLMEKYNGFN